MAESDYSKASVLLFDPVHLNQRTTRYALHEIGFRKIEAVTSLADLKTFLSDATPDLLVAESGATDMDVFKIVRSIRRGELGLNPFMVILLTTWIRDTNHIRRGIECGADDLIVRPFSTTFAEERVRSLVRKRKEFIVTSDYVGPDRRKDANRSSDIQGLEVPNMLQAQVDGDESALAKGAGWVKEAREAVTNERIRRLAMRNVIAAELFLSHDEANGPRPALDFDDIDRTTREMHAHLFKANRSEAVEITAVLLDQIKSLRRAGEGLMAGAKLIKELSMGAYAAFADMRSVEDSRDEIGRTVAGLRKRLQSRAQPASGHAAEAGIKRAAM
ncbi:two-component system response regulator [Maricaulis sp. D1M11]|uniref:response regulator n=1 Tax=Maricaulis sp. D1M11 TaxID=3076117 RepID=UPI0039B6C6A9